MATENVHRAYYQGKLVAYMKKNGVALRYKLYRIDKQYLTRYFRVSPKVEGHEIINERIDTLESKIDKTISSLLLKDPKMVITASIIDNAIAEQEKEVKEVEKRKTVRTSLVTAFTSYIEEKKAIKHQEDTERGLNRKLHPTIKDYISVCNAIKDYEYDCIPKYALTTLMRNGLMTLLTSLLNLMKAIRSTSIVVKETCVTRLSTKG